MTRSTIGRKQMKKAFFGSFALVALAVPVLALAPVKSGLEVGEMVSAFHPTHVSGPDAGTDTCPPCKYGNRPQVQVWSNMDDSENTLAIAKNLNEKVKASKHELKAFMINLAHCDKCIDGTKTLAGKAKLDNVAITYLASDTDYVKNYKVNTSNEVKNTVFVYKDRKVVAKFVNLKADKDGLAALNAAIAKIDK